MVNQHYRGEVHPAEISRDGQSTLTGSDAGPDRHGKDATNWYVFKSQPGRERLAEAHLKNQNFELFVPKLKVTHRNGNRLFDATRPLFPGYGFVAFDGSVARWRSINGTRGVSYLVSSGEKPSPVPHGFISSLLEGRGEDDLVDLNGDLKVGDTVELVSGPFARQIGTLVKLNASGRVRVLLSALGGSLPVETRAEKVIPYN